MSKISVVVDMNKIFSALIKPTSRIALNFIDERFQFYAPNFIIVELFKYRNRLLELSPLSENEFLIFLKQIIENITFIKPTEINLSNHVRAFEYCKDIDEKDQPYVALAFELNSRIWSGDKELREGLLAKGMDIFIDL